MLLSPSVCSESGPPIFTSFLAFFRAFLGPQIKFSHILMHRPCRDLQNLKFSCLYLISFSHKVVPQKASCRGGGGGGESRGGRGWGRVPHFYWSIYKGGHFFWTRNRLRMVSKVRNFWLCVFSGAVATTLIISSPFT